MWSPLMLLRALLALGWSALVVLLLGTSVWAAHPAPPVPSLAPGSGLVPSGETCKRDLDGLGGETGHHCVPSGWVVLVPSSPGPYPMPVTVLTPLPVAEANPVPVDQSTNTYQQTITNHEACGGSPTSSPSPNSTPTPSASASASPTSTVEYDDACVVRVASRQWIIGGLFAAVFLLLALVGFVRHEAKGLTT